MLVRDLVEDDRFRPQVMGAAHRLDDPIRWVHITDLADPSEYLRGGELVLTSALWHREAADAERFVGALAERDVHALGIALHDRAPVPEGLVEACVRRDVLLLVMPDVAFIDITEGVITRLMDERRRESDRLVALERTLVSGLARGDGGRALVEALEDVLGVRCWLLQRDGDVVHTGDAPPVAVRRAAWREGFGRRQNAEVIDIRPPLGPRMTAVRVTAGASRVGAMPRALVVFECSAAVVYEHDAVAIGVPAWYVPLAVELTGVPRRSRRDTARDLVDRLRAGGGTGDAETASAVREVAGIASQEIAAVAVAADLEDDLAADATEAAARFIGLSTGVVVAGADGAVGLFDPGRFADSTTLSARVLESLGFLLDGHIHVGSHVGQASAVGAVLDVAILARAVAASSAQRRAAATSADVGSARLLLALSPTAARTTLSERLIEPLARHDADRGSDLVDTLETFLESACSWTAAAKVLHLHVNTLRYRMHQVELITGRDMSSMSTRVDLYLAVTAYRSLRRGGGRPTP